MRYLEMYGLPGAGKTTIAKPVIEKLRNEGYLVCDLHSVYFRKCKDGRKGKILFEMITSGSLYKLYFLCFIYGLSLSRCKESFNYLFKLIFLIHQIINTMKEGKYDLVLCEEGIIQYVSSLSYLNKLSKSKLFIKCLTEIKKKIEVEAIECSLSVEESVSRINGRNQRMSKRFSSNVPASVLHRAMQVKQENLLLISSYFYKIHTLSMDCESSSNEDGLFDLVSRGLSIKG